MHYHSLLAYLTGIALTIPLSTRQATLHACLTSTHAFFSFLFSVPVIDWYKFTYISWAQTRHNIILLQRLSSFESPDWDLSHVREILDLSLIIQNVINQVEKIQSWSTEDGDGQGGGFISRLLPKMREYKEAFENRRASILGEEVTPSGLPPPLTMDDLTFGQLDDMFWQEIVAEWNWLSPDNLAMTRDTETNNL